MTTVTFSQLRDTEPASWLASALAWRNWAAISGDRSAELSRHLTHLRAAWTGAAAGAAATGVERMRRSLVLFRLMCWEIDQALSEFAAALSRAKTLLAHVVAEAARTSRSLEDGTSADLAVALQVAADADSAATRRLSEVADATGPEVPPPPAASMPSCAATPAEVRHWWDSLTPEQRRWLIATQPAWLGPLDGVPAAFRDLANRLLLEDRRADLDHAIAGAHGHELRRLRDERHGFDRLVDRLADGGGPRAYLLRLDVTHDGRAVVALGDPDRAANVLTHVPGMTADLASYRGELNRAEREAVRTAELGPTAATSTVMWLDYDAPDFVDEAARATQAEAGAATLRRFQEGLRATHEGDSAHLTVLGHSYGSLVVGSAARTPGLAADSVVFVGSPGVGVDSARELHVPGGQVWSSTSRSDVIQYAAVSPRSFVEDLALSRALPGLGTWYAFGRPENDLWFGTNPSDAAFGAHVFRSQPDGGHLGYWDSGSESLDNIAAIALGRTA